MAAVLAVIATSAAAFAQTASAASDARSLYAGTWTGTTTTYDSSYSKAGKTTSRTACTWHGGTAYLVCDLQFTDGQTAGNQLSVYTRAADGSYHFTRVDERGGSHDMETVVAPGVWSYTTQFTAGGVPVLLRVRNTFPNPNHYDVRIDASTDGGHRWTTLGNGVNDRVPNP